MCAYHFWNTTHQMQRHPLGPVTPERVGAEEVGFLLEDLLDFALEEQIEDEELLEGLMNTLGTNELERIAASLELHPPDPPDPTPHPPRKKKRTSNTKHSDAYKKVRHMR